MADNNIVELTPFRADLTRAMARRGERLLASTDLAEQVAALEPLEAYYIVRDVGFDQALPILLQLNQKQLETCVDLDCWNRHDFAVTSLDEWLTAFSLAGPETLAETFFSLDYVVQLLFMAKTVTVYDPDTDEVPQMVMEGNTSRAMTPDGFYLLESKEDINLKIHPFTLLDALYQYDLTAAHQLLSEVRVDLSIQIEEEALHFRSGRMQDIGFVTPDEAVLLFTRPDIRKSSPRPQKPIDGPVSHVPSVYAKSFIETTLLQQALSLITNQEELSRLEQEIVWTINSAIVAYGEKTQDTKQISDIAERVRDTISLGLESLLAKDTFESPVNDAAAVAKASDLLGSCYISDLFRHGFAATQNLQQEIRLALRDSMFRAWYDLAETQQSDDPEDRLERAFVSALLRRHPLRGGFDLAKVEDVKAFACLAEIDAAHVRLQLLVANVCGLS